MVFALIGAAQILYYGLARLLGVSNPGNVGTDIVAAMASPVAVVVVYGAAWFLLRRRLARDTGSHEVDRQAGVRRLYTNLAALVSMAALGAGAAGVLWNLAEQIEAPLIGVKASDWRDPISFWGTLFVVGVAVWLAHWRHAPWPGDRQSLSRRLYVWAALLVSVLAVLGSGIALLNVVLQQVFSASPRLDSTANLDFGHYLAVLVVAVIIGVYHWRVLRADAASRPAKHEVEAAPVIAVASAAADSTVATIPATSTSASSTSRGKRYVAVGHGCQRRRRAPGALEPSPCRQLPVDSGIGGLTVGRAYSSHDHPLGPQADRFRQAGATRAPARVPRGRRAGADGR